MEHYFNNASICSENMNNHNNNENKGKIFFEWRKVPLMLPLEKVRLFVNDMQLPSLVMNRDSNFEITIPADYVTVKAKTLFRSATKTINLDLNKNYICKIKYGRLSGRLTIEFFASVQITTMVKLN